MLRRSFLLSSSLFGLAYKTKASDAIERSAPHSSSKVSFITAAQSQLGEHSFVCFDKQMNILNEHEISARGHSFAHSSDGHIAAIARRPSDFCVILNSDGEKVVEFNAQPDRHFYGHGVYSADGHFLYLTENDYAHEGTRGVIGVYDVNANYQRINELSSYGIGPHEIALSRNGKELIIANGGIETHPSTGRKKLNISSMQPSLVHIDRQSGQLINQSSLDQKYHQNSIRHMVLSDDDHIYIGLQKQKKTKKIYSIAHFNPETKQLKKIAIPTESQDMLNGYVGDICLDQSGRYLAVSSPKGGAVLFINLLNGDTQNIKIDDVCGLAPSIEKTKQFIVSSGQGNILLVSLESERINQKLITGPSLLKSWDNHILSIA